MKWLQVCKAVFYPIAGVFQFYLFEKETGSRFLHPNPLLPVCGIALIALGIINLKRAIGK